MSAAFFFIWSKKHHPFFLQEKLEWRLGMRLLICIATVGVVVLHIDIMVYVFIHKQMHAVCV